MAKPEGREETRAELYGEEIPDLPASARLVDVWRELGPGKQDWIEIDAFIRASGRSLVPVEAICLVEMSRAFSSEIGERSPFRIAPMERSA